MKKNCVLGVLVLLLWGQAESRAVSKNKKTVKTEVTPYQVAQNIRNIIQWLDQHKSDMSDVEAFLVKRRAAAVDLYKAEGYYLLTMAKQCFPTNNGEDFHKLIKWIPVDPFQDKDVYREGLKTLMDHNQKYSVDPFYKATQTEVARDKIREVVHENILSIIDRINTIANLLPSSFSYTGHPYEGISPLDHVALYNVLSNKDKINISPLDARYHRWQVALYKNLFLLLKLIARQILSTAGNGKNMTDDDRKILEIIAQRELGDDEIDLPKD